MSKAKYLIIYNTIKEDIKAGSYSVGDKLPSEKELMTEYQVSRDTIRKALNLLEESGFIHKIKGKGSFVLDINKLSFPFSGIKSFKELMEEGKIDYRNKVEKLNLIDGNRRFRRQLELEPGEKAWELYRTREIDGERTILDKDYINSSYVPRLSKKVAEKSLYDYIENDLGLTIGFAKKEIVVEEISQEDRELLDLDKYKLVVVVRSFTYLDNARLFQYTESRHRPDKFKFVDFARRQL